MMKQLRTLLLMLALITLAIPGTTLADGVTLSQEQQRAIDEINRYRRRVGVQPTTVSSKLHTSASNHARYIVETGEWGHYETITSSPYYTGYKSKDRAAHAGYTNDNVSENWMRQSFGTTGARTYLVVDNAIQWWMTGIYHRFPIVSPRTEHAGYGPYYKGDKASQILNFGTNWSLTGPLTRWPLKGQKGVGIELRGESPNPLEQFGGAFPSGYPVSMTWYRGAVKDTSITMVRTRDGLSIPGYKLNPQNDVYHGYSTSLSFIPKAPLKYNTEYTVTFQGVFAANGDLNSGDPFTHTWSFTTMPAPGKRTRSAPANNSTGAPLSPDISLTFNRPMRSYTLVPYTGAPLWSSLGIKLVRASDGVPVNISITQPATARTQVVSLKPMSALQPNTRYRLDYTLADAWGRPQRGAIYFTTGGS